jgi:oxaloacetate decarboxylase beta subunit
MDMLISFISTTGFVAITWQNIVMILFGCLFVYLAVTKGYEPLLLLPIGFGLIVGNIPLPPGMSSGEEGSFFYIIYQGVSQGIYPPLIFLGVGAMTDFSSMLSNPRLVLLGAAAQFGIFITLIGALFIGFAPAQAGAIAIIGGADGPTAIFLASKLAPELLGSIAIAAYSYMSLVPVMSAADHAPADIQGRTANPDGGVPPGQQKRKNYFSDCRFPDLYLDCSRIDGFDWLPVHG